MYGKERVLQERVWAEKHRGAPRLRDRRKRPMCRRKRARPCSRQRQEKRKYTKRIATKLLDIEYVNRHKQSWVPRLIFDAAELTTTRKYQHTTHPNAGRCHMMIEHTLSMTRGPNAPPTQALLTKRSLQGA